MRRTRTLALVAALVVSAVAAGCGSSTQPAERADDPAAETTVMPSTSSTPTTAPPQSDEEAVLAAVHGYWDSFIAANDPSNPDHPDLTRYAMGEAADIRRSNIVDRASLGQAVRLPANSQFASHVSAVTISGDNATATDCLVDDSQLVDQTSGRVLNSELETFLFTLRVTHTPEGWKVSNNVKEQEWKGRAGCALASS